jgi:uncharacterized protein (DUF2384 family)
VNELLTDTLLGEYETLIADLVTNPTDEQIVQALVEQADWTDRGAHTILKLAQEYGSAILRNALALANAMDIEDGESGM